MKQGQGKAGQSKTATKSNSGKVTKQNKQNKDVTKADTPNSETLPKGPMPAQKQKRPGIEAKMTPRPEFLAPKYRGAGKLLDKVALITGGDSGIGRSVAVLYAREGADVAIVYLKEEEVDARNGDAH
jgi:hypothetical protein